MFIHTVYSRRKATSFVDQTRRPGRNWREDDDDGIDSMLRDNDNGNDEDFGIDSYMAGGLGGRLGLDGGAGGRQDWGRLMSDRSQSQRQDSPLRHVSPPSSQRNNDDLWERDSSD